MVAKKCIIYFLILLLTVYPASAADVTLNKWVLNVTVHDDGRVEDVIQIEIDNAGSQPLEGISFIVPASEVLIIYDFGHTSSFTGQVIKQRVVQGGVELTVSFNKSVEAGKKWNGRIGFLAENWATKEDSNYSIDIPVEAPLAIVSGTAAEMAVSEGAEIRSQVFLPESIEVISVTPPPFRILFQYDHMVPTWSPDELKIGDTISIKGSFSEILNKIVEIDARSKVLSARVEEARKKGIDVSEAEQHLAYVNEYNNNQALQSFWKKENSKALEYTGYANDQLELAENSLANTGTTGSPPERGTSGNEQAPGFGVLIFTLALLITFLLKRRK